MNSPITRIPVAAALALGLLAGPAAGQEILTPDDAVTLALEQNPMVKAADDAVTAADAERNLAGSGYQPRLDFEYDYGYSTNPVFVFASKLGQERFGPQDFDIEALNRPDPFANAASRIVVRQNIWDAGRSTIGKRAAGYGVEAADSERERTRDAIAFGALRAFWDAVLADEMLRVVRSAEQAAEANLELTRNQVDVGIAVQSDALAAEVRYAEVRAMRIRAEYGTRVARAALHQALGLEDHREFTLSPTVVPAPTAGDDLDARIDEALERRADLRSIDARMMQADEGEKIARSYRKPIVGVGGMFEANDPNIIGAEGTNWSVGLSLRLPLYNGSESGARKARAAADRSRIEAMRRGLSDGIRLEVSAAWADRASAAERLEVAQSALGHAQETLRIVRERYAEGMAVIVELLGAEASLTQAEANVIQARRDLAVASAALELASGRPLADQAAAEEPEA